MTHRRVVSDQRKHKRFVSEAQNWHVPEEYKLYRALPQGGAKQPAHCFLRAARRALYSYSCYSNCFLRPPGTA